MGLKKILKLSKCCRGAQLGGSGDSGGGSGGGSIKAEEYSFLKPIEGEETAGGRVGANYEELEGVGAEVYGGEEVISGGGN